MMRCKQASNGPERSQGCQGRYGQERPMKHCRQAKFARGRSGRVERDAIGPREFGVGETYRRVGIAPQSIRMVVP